MPTFFHTENFNFQSSAKIFRERRGEKRGTCTKNIISKASSFIPFSTTWGPLAPISRPLPLPPPRRLPRLAWPILRPDGRGPRARPPAAAIAAEVRRRAEERRGDRGGPGDIVRSTGRKDRHSKVSTAKGPRDRRVRLSAHTAIQFYDVQDRLGYDRSSKAVDWLINNAKAAIDELAELPAWHPNSTPAVSASNPQETHAPATTTATITKANVTTRTPNLPPNRPSSPAPLIWPSTPPRPAGPSRVRGWFHRMWRRRAAAEGTCFRRRRLCRCTRCSARHSCLGGPHSFGNRPPDAPCTPSVGFVL